MINRVVLVGRLTRDIELRKTTSGLSSTTFTVACDRRYQSKDPNGPTADFIQCVAWRQQADFLAQYARKGSIVGVEGHITTRSYDGANGRVYVTEVTCESVRLIGGSPRQETRDAYQAPSGPSGYQGSTMSAPASRDYSTHEDDFSNTPSLDISSDDLPFY